MAELFGLRWHNERMVFQPADLAVQTQEVFLHKIVLLFDEKTILALAA